MSESDGTLNHIEKGSKAFTLPPLVVHGGLVSRLTGTVRLSALIVRKHFRSCFRSVGLTTIWLVILHLFDTYSKTDGTPGAVIINVVALPHRGGDPNGRPN